MGEMLLNGRLYGANGIRELTQSQYDALPASKYTDGILYCITDADPEMVTGFSPVIYSLAERQVGTWIDGKPLYEKTIDCGTLPNSAAKLTEVGVSNIEDVKDMRGIAISSSNNVCITLPTSTSNYIISISYQKSSNSVEILTTNDRSAYRGYITIQYTKTTDVPGSGDWTTDGVPTHHYSTSEKVIGTWIDGKPIYEKTFKWENHALSSGVNTISLGINNIENICYVYAQTTNSGHTNVRYLDYYDLEHSGATDSLSYQVLFDGTFRITTKDTWGSPTIFLTIQYTKTTD